MTTKEGRSCALIPGLSTSKTDPHAFLQYIDGFSGQTAYLRFPLSDFATRDEPFQVTVKDNQFSETGLVLQTRGPVSFEGTLSFGPWTPYPSGFLKPGIMGPFGLPGFLECYHGVVSAGHSVEGRLRIQTADFETVWDFTGGKGYIEKDWGQSFPVDYVWIQANQFVEPETSVFVSLAAIPFRGLDFPGLIAFVHRAGHGFVTFATWNGAKVLAMEITDTHYTVVLSQGEHTLTLRAKQTAAGNLQAPAGGTMDRVIKESVDGELEFTLTQKGQPVASGTSRGAGLEQGGRPSNLATWFLTGKRPS